jgi:hypothetical protein
MRSSPAGQLAFRAAGQVVLVQHPQQARPHRDETGVRYATLQVTNVIPFKRDSMVNPVVADA